MRIAFTALALALALASEATAAPQSLAPMPENESFALAGDAALVTDTTARRVRIDRWPLVSGVPPTTVFRHVAEGLHASASVAASDELAGVAVISDQRRTGRLIGEEFAGPPEGSWTALGPPRVMRQQRFIPVGHDVDGGRLFTAELSTSATLLRWVVREPGAQPRTVSVPRRVITSAVSGDLVAYALSDEVTVENWRTGAQIARYSAPRAIDWLDLRADGALVTADIDGNVVVYLPGAAPRRLARRGAGPSFAGDRIVFIGRAGRSGVVSLYVAEPDGRVRRFGVPSAGLDEFVADEQRVLWRGNGCLLTAPITEPAADAPDAGACPRSEVSLPDEISRPIKRDRRVLVRVDCIAAAPPGCRGTLTLRPVQGGQRLAKPRRFRVPVGDRARLNVRLTRRGYNAVVRRNRQIGGAPVNVRTVTVDPDGRRHVQLHHLVINVR